MAKKMGTETIHLIVQFPPSYPRKQRKTLEKEFAYCGVAPVISTFKGLPGPGGITKQFENIQNQEIYEGHVSAGETGA